MGRAPCCDKAVKKGPWTPEEDIALVSYIQEHGPGNWRNVPSHTGLMRCSKSCRLRWTNYLRPGIKRGNFTPYEDRMIVHLQALLGNRWAAIASYLPQRTDNDIKNYWNTHLKKRLKKMQMHSSSSDNDFELLKQSTSTTTPKGQWESRLQTDIHHAKQALFEALNMNNPPYTTTPLVTPSVSPVMGSPYAASLENLTRLLEGWKQTQPSSSKDAMNFPSSASTSTCSETSGDAVANDVQIGVAPSKATCMEEGNFTWASPFNSSSFNSSSCDDIASINDLESSYKKNMNNIEAAVAMEEGEVPLNMLEKWLMMEESMQNQNQNQNQNQSYQEQLGINSNTASTELQYPYMVESDIKNELCVTPD